MGVVEASKYCGCSFCAIFFDKKLWLNSYCHQNHIQCQSLLKGGSKTYKNKYSAPIQPAVPRMEMIIAISSIIRRMIKLSLSLTSMIENSFITYDMQSRQNSRHNSSLPLRADTGWKLVMSESRDMARLQSSRASLLLPIW